jgi:GAF domain-containing protein
MPRCDSIGPTRPPIRAKWAAFGRFIRAPSDVGADAEKARPRLLAEHDLLRVESEPDLDAIVSSMQSYFDVPMAVINVVHGQYFFHKARRGVPDTRIHRANTFSCKTVGHDSLFVVEDSCVDPAWKDNRLVVEPPNMRFYAGAPLLRGAACPIGTIAISDTRPRSFSGTDLMFLRAMARHAAELLGAGRRREARGGPPHRSIS